MRFREAYFWIGVPLALLCVWVWLFWVPFSSQIEGKKRELTDIEARIARAEAELLQPKDAKTDGNGRIAAAMPPDQIPRLEAFPDYMKRIASSAKNGGVTINRLNGRLNDGNGEATSMLAYPVTEIDFTGRFIDIGRTLEQIQGAKAYRRIIRARLVAVENVYPHIKGNVEIEFKAWRN